MNRDLREVELNNLTEGRTDLLARCVNAALWLDRDIRRDVEIIFCFSNGKTVRINGDVRQMRPDERNIGGFIKGIMNGKRYPGICLEEQSFDDVLKKYPQRYSMDIGGTPLGAAEIREAVFVLGDDEGLPESGGEKISVGPRSYLTSHCIVAINNHLDKVEK